MTPEERAAIEFCGCDYEPEGKTCDMGPESTPDDRCEYCGCLFQLRAAILAERERCAKVIEDWSVAFMVDADPEAVLNVARDVFASAVMEEPTDLHEEQRVQDEIEELRDAADWGDK